MRKEAVVGKTSYRWEQLLLLIFGQTKAQDGNIALSSKQVSQGIKKGLLLLAFVSCWWWNGQLLLATTVGIGMMWLTYKISNKRYRKLWQAGINWLTGHNRRLLLAVGSGSLGGFFTYMVAATWSNTENHWLATGSILQSLGTFMTLILLGWQINRHNGDRILVKFDRLLEDLTATDNLKRLIAIRQLTNLAYRNDLTREQKLQLVEYFQFMLAQPQDLAIQEALLDSFDILGISSPSSISSPTIVTPIKLKHSVSENIL